MNRLRGIRAMQVAEAKAKKLVEQEEAQRMKAHHLAEQAIVKAAKAIQKAKRTTKREENQKQRALLAMERVEGRQTVVPGGEVQSGKNSSLAS